MKTFYVTFGAGSILRGYNLEVKANDDSIVAAWLKREGIRYSRILDKQPTKFDTKPLQAESTDLFYLSADHIR